MPKTSLKNQSHEINAHMEIKKLIQEVLESVKYSEYLSPNQIAEIINHSPITVRKWCRDGKIPYSKFGRSVRVRTEDFNKFCSDMMV
jgi:excisionase family DNA binding protein